MMSKLIKKLSSIKLAVALILFLAALSLIGILIPQIPPAFSASPSGYAWWVENVAFKTLGTTVYTLEPLGLFNIFHSVWFLCASGLLLLNILACTLSRAGALKIKAEQAKPNIDPEFYQNGKNIYEFEIPSTPITQMGEMAVLALDNRNYSVIKEDTAKNIYIAGDRHRLSSWGTFPVHFSLILLIVGALVGIFFGFRDDSFTLAEGTTKDIGYNTGLSVHLNSFADTYWDNGTPKDFRSDVDIYKDGAIVKSGIIRVNHPLIYQGVRLHQGSYGQAVNLKISDLGGATVLNDSIPLSGMRENDSLSRPEGEVVLPNNNYHVIILGHATNGTDPYIGKDEIGVEFYDANMTFLGWLVLAQNTQQKMGDLSFTYSSLHYTGLMVSKEPGATFVWSAAVLFLIGLGMIFYFPHRKIWITLSSGSKTGTKVTVKVDSLRELGLGNAPPPIVKALGLTEKPEGSQQIGS